MRTTITVRRITVRGSACEQLQVQMSTVRVRVIALPAKGYCRRADCVLFSQLGQQGSPISQGLGSGAVGEAVLCSGAAEGWVAQRLVSVLREDQQCTHLRSELPHQAGVVDVFFNRAFVPGIEEDRPRGARGTVKASVRCTSPPGVVHAVPLWEGATLRAKVVDRLLEGAPGAVGGGRPR